MPDRVQKSSRSLRRSLLASRIESSGFPAPSSCSRCIFKSLECLCRRTGCCSECVRSGMDKKCDVNGSRTDRVLREQEAALDKAIQESLEASAKVSRLQKIVKGLKNKSEKEMDDMMKELKNESGDENNGGEGSSGPGTSASNEGGSSRSTSAVNENERGIVSEGLSPSSWFDRFMAEAGQGSPFPS